MANKKEKCEKFAVCLCPQVSSVCFLVGLLLIVRLIMAVMAILFAQPFHFFKGF